MIKVAHNNGSPLSIPKPNFGSHFDGEFFHFFETQEESDAYFASLPVPEKVEEPIIVAAWQLRLQLTEMGLKDQVEMAIYALPEPDRTRALTVWEYGNTIKQYSPLIDMIANELGLTEKEVTDIFEAANNIEL